MRDTMPRALQNSARMPPMYQNTKYPKKGQEEGVGSREGIYPRPRLCVGSFLTQVSTPMPDGPPLHILTHGLTNLLYVEGPLDKPPLLLALPLRCIDPPSILSLGPWSEKSWRVLLLLRRGWGGGEETRSRNGEQNESIIGEKGVGAQGRVLDSVHRYSRMTIDPRIPITPGRSTPGYTDQADIACTKRGAPLGGGGAGSLL